MIKNQNEELSGKKVELTQELKKAKDDLSNLIEKGESQKNQYLKEINNLKEMERKLAETRDKEKKQFEELWWKMLEEIWICSDFMRILLEALKSILFFKADPNATISDERICELSWNMLFNYIFMNCIRQKVFYFSQFQSKVMN